MAQGPEGESGAVERNLRPPPADELGGHGDRLPINPEIERLTRWLAIVGGTLMMVAIAVTLVSVVGRYAFGAPVPGDYEIVEQICGVGTFLFFPYAHATGSNIVVEFFTLRVPARQRLALDLAHDVIFTAVAALLAWRLSIGFADKFTSDATTALVRIPFWWSYGFAVASMVLLCVVCMARIVAMTRALQR
jgi:TRAP-type C4-dicarboxylate transport system permease small subunit